MRIPYTNIATPVFTTSSLATPRTPKSLDPAPLREPKDSFKQQSKTTEQIIDAEYVEFYTPKRHSFAKERQDLDSSIEAEKGSRSKTARSSPVAAVLNSYQTTASKPAPLPGSLISFFA